MGRILTDEPEYGFTLHDEPDFFHPRILVNGIPFQPAARDWVEAENHQVESNETAPAPTVKTLGDQVPDSDETATGNTTKSA